MQLLLMMTSLAFFCASWLALQLSKQVTRPVEALANAMRAVAHGDYNRRVSAATTQELGELASVFNLMATELENSRRLVDRSTLQVVQANTALEARRHELETMLETIPNGVVMLDAAGRILVANRAFSRIAETHPRSGHMGLGLVEIMPQAAASEIAKLLERAARKSLSTTELHLESLFGEVEIVATAALVQGNSKGPESPRGFVVVLEDVTDLQRAQKQAAWKEVARRVAHEIKNPLTPISLSAEQMRRHAVRLTELLQRHQLPTASAESIQRSTEVISSSVETMRLLVDQFSTLAEFPVAEPRPADLNTLVQDTLSTFRLRLGGIRLTRSLEPSLPPVMADAESLRRALANLIENAMEAMTGSLLKEITVSTCLSGSSDHMLEVSVSDTGPGVTDEVREQLFLPYYSTKERGTGLGLAIVAKVVADHKGTIRTEKNTPSGARFVIELPIAMQQPDAELASAGTAGATG